MGSIEREAELLAYQQDLELGKRMVERSRQESLSRRGKRIVIQQTTEYSPKAYKESSDNNTSTVIEGTVAGVGVNNKMEITTVTISPPEEHAPGIVVHLDPVVSEIGTTATRVLYYEDGSLTDPQAQPLELVQAA